MSSRFERLEAGKGGNEFAIANLVVFLGREMLHVPSLRDFGVSICHEVARC